MPKKKEDDLDLFTVDENNLLEEWDKQSLAVFEYNEKLAYARRDLNWAKVQQDVAEAETAKRVREDPEKYGLDNPTIPAIKDVVTIRMGKHATTKALINAQHTVDILHATIEALDNRKRALQDHASLFIAKYWGRPQEPQDEDGSFDKLKDQRFARRIKKKRVK